MDPAWKEVLRNIDLSRQHKFPITKPIIFRVPPIIRSRNPDAYEPQLVSIGPYHHGKCSLQAMEKIKWQTLDKLLSLTPKATQHCLQEMLDVEAEARSYYAEVIDMESHKFAEMLLLDGCFIIHLFTAKERVFNEVIDCLMTDNIWIQTRLLQDLVLMENQLPFFIFKRLHGVLNIAELPDFLELQSDILSLFHVILPNSKFSPFPQPNQEVAHLLHLLRESILSIPPKKSNASRSASWFPQKSSLFVVPSVTELVEAGIKIRVREADNFLDISFDKGVLHIPAIQVDDYTNLIFRNLIALEQFRSDVGMNITCYSRFMDSIINTERDVALLSRERIIYNGLGSDKDIASIFNELCEGVTFVGWNYLAPLLKDVNAYYNSRCNKWRAKLMHDYFSNPWAIISVIAATFLLILTVVQTVFSVLSYTQQIHSIDRPRL